MNLSKKIIVTAVILVFIAGLILTGCKTTTAQETTAAEVTTAAETTATAETETAETTAAETASVDEVAKNKAGDIINIAAIDFPQFEVYTYRINEAMKAATDYGVKYRLIVPAEITVESNVEAITNAVNQNFDAIIFEPWVPDAFKEVVDMAKSQGIPMVNVHVPYNDESGYISQIVVDNAQYGINAADIINKEKGGKANIMILMNAPDIENQRIQKEAFEKRCAELSPDLKIVTTEFTMADAVKGAEVMEAAFNAHPEIDAMLFLESGSISSAVSITKELGINDKVMILGIDANKDVVESIKKGELWGTLVQNMWKQGYESIRNIVDYYLGNPFPKNTDAGAVLITKDNVDNWMDTMLEPIAVKGKPYPNL